jgi:hypothetical protein
MSTGEEIGLLILAAFFLVVIWLLLHPRRAPAGRPSPYAVIALAGRMEIRLHDYSSKQLRSRMSRGCCFLWWQRLCSCRTQSELLVCHYITFHRRDLIG